MNFFSYPHHGRFSRQDVTKSKIAHNAVFDGLQPADMVYVNGRMDHPYTVNPIRIRAYDKVGNLLAAIRLNDIRDHDYTSVTDKESFLRNPSHGYVITAKNRVNQDFVVFGEQVIDIPINDFVVTPDGTIYCAMAPGFYPANVPKFGYTIQYVLTELSSLTGPAFELRKKEISDKVDVYFYGYFRKYNRNGDRIPFPDLHGSLITCIELDASGNIYVGGYPISDEQYFLRKYNSAGVLQWSVGTTESQNDANFLTGLFGVYNFVLDITNNVYAVGKEGAKSFFKKISNSGVVQWTKRLPSDTPFNSVAIDDEGYLYTAGYSEAYKEENSETLIQFNAEGTTTSVQKWDSSGNLIGSASYEKDIYNSGGARIRCIVYANGELHLRNTFTSIEDELYIVCGTDLIRRERNITNLTTVAPRMAFDRSSRLYSSVFKENNQINIQGILYGDPLEHLLVLDESGDHLWTDRNALGDTSYPPYTDPLSHYITDNGLSTDGWRCGPQLYNALTVGHESNPLPYYRTWAFNGRAIYLLNESEMPSLSPSVVFGESGWLGDLYSTIPGLPMRFALSLVQVIRDYVGPARPIVYRLYLTGMPDIELKISSFSIRRSVTAYSLSIVIPIESGAQMTAIEARSTGELVLKRGVNLSAGNEQLDELLRIPLNGLRFDEGSNSFSVTLDGVTNSPEVNSKTRTLTGISYRNMDGGLRRVRCAVDTYLVPNDIADLGGGETMIIGELVYTVNAQTAVMECTEVNPA